MLEYKRAQLKITSRPNAIKGYLMATRAIRTILLVELCSTSSPFCLFNLLEPKQ